MNQGGGMVRIFCMIGVTFSACFGQAFAQESSTQDTYAYSRSASLGVVSEYTSRGLRLNWGDPAIQAGAEIQHSSGWYLGTWASPITDKFYANGSYEIDLYAGQRGKIREAINYDAGLGAYFYPGANYNRAVPAGPDQRYDTTEAIIGLSYEWFALKYYYCLTDYYGYNDHSVPVSAWNSGISGGITQGQNTRGSAYLEVNANFGLTDVYSLGLHAGHQTVSHSVNLNYSDFKLSLTADPPRGWTTSLAASTTRGAGIFRNFLAVDGSGYTMDPAGTHWLFSVNKSY
jgi:hypothetical protein